MAAAAGSLLLIPAVAAGDTLAWATALPARPADAPPPVPTDPGTVGADGSLPASAAIGKEFLTKVGDPAALANAGPPVSLPNGPVGIPGAALQAYMRAAELMKSIAPDCHIGWPLLASIGRIESNHARGGRVDAAGNTLAPILGPVLNGGGFAAIADTDGGRYDGDPSWDRAVGPMQFIPSTWAGYASDGNGDGVANPSNVFDATLGAARYLCSGGLDLADPKQQAVAVFRYNHSEDYVRTVLLWADAYARGVTPLPMTPVPNDVLQDALAPHPPSAPGTAPRGTTGGGPGTTTTIPGRTTTTIGGAPGGSTGSNTGNNTGNNTGTGGSTGTGTGSTGTGSTGGSTTTPPPPTTCAPPPSSSTTTTTTTTTTTPPPSSTTTTPSSSSTTTPTTPTTPPTTTTPSC